MAGIKAAGDLYQGGMTDTLILEARDRVGGRLVSVNSSLNRNLKYDMGALWFHDALKNPLFEKAKKLGNVNYFFDDGKNDYVSEKSASIPPWKFERVVEEISTYCQLAYESDPSKKDISLHELCNEYLEKYGSLLNSDEHEYALQVVRMWLEMWDGILWDDSSSKHAFAILSHLGRNAFVTNGYTTVLENEASVLPDGYRHNNIKLNTKVEKIDYSSDNVVVVKTKDETFTADYVVVTIPLSLLSLLDPTDQSYVSWEPQLPSRFTDIWPHSSFGSLGKVVFEFKDCFWSKDTHRYYVLASETDGSGKPRPWQHPTLLVNYYPMTQTPSLVALTQKPVLRQVENMTEDEIWALFEPVVAKIATGPVQKPFKIHCTPWNNDPWTRGSYSATEVGSIDPSIIGRTFAGGVTDRVRFAGADTAEGSSNGCAHGAWFTGEREARHILTHAKVGSKL